MHRNICEVIEGMARAKRVETRSMKDPKKEIGSGKLHCENTVKSWMLWTRHLEEKFPKSIESEKHRGCRKRGRHN